MNTSHITHTHTHTHTQTNTPNVYPCTVQWINCPTGNILNLSLRGTRSIKRVSTRQQLISEVSIVLFCVVLSSCHCFTVYGSTIGERSIGRDWDKNIRVILRDSSNHGPDILWVTSIFLCVLCLVTMSVT